MKKMFFMAAIAALALSSCSSDEIVASQTVEDGAVSFSANVLRDTRAYNSDNIDLPGLQDAQSPGFGVYAYEQGSSQWAKYHLTNTVPNFFYNQQVTYNASKWTYDPVKYWSNNAGALHSFFAYAPFKNGSNSVFSAEGPGVRYNATENYDLLAAEPVTDKTKQDIHETVNFDFGHALSKVSFQVVPFVDEEHNGTHTAGLNKLDANTTIYVRSIKLVGQVASQGVYNLASKKWTAEAIEEGAYEVAVADFKLDKDNDDAYQDYGTSITVIPTLNSQKAKIQVIYDVVTTDALHPQNSSSITNKVTSVDEFELTKGTSYLFKLDLGLTTVKFDAAVTSWSEPTTEKTVDIPNNHKFEALSTVTDLNAAAITSINTFNLETPTFATTDYKLVENVLKVGNGSDAWGDAPQGSYSYGQNIYVVTTAGSACTHSTPDACKTNESTAKYAYWTGSAWSSTSAASVVYSLEVNSEGKIQVVSDPASHPDTWTWTPPVENGFYTLKTTSGALYIWK